MPRTIVLYVVGFFGLMSVNGTVSADSTELLELPQGELRCLFHGAVAGPVPCGSFEGETVFVPSQKCHRIRTGCANKLWQGKKFGCGSMINLWAGGAEAVPGRVSFECSLLDGRPCHVITYRDARIWNDVRDEIRQIGPGLYLGIMLEVSGPRPVIRSFFLLERSLP